VEFSWLNMAKLDRAWIWALLAVGWMAFIYALSDRPSGDFDDANDAVRWLPFASVIVHTALYFILSVFVLRAFLLLRPVTEGLIAYSTIFVALVYGLLDEFHQSSIEGRSSEVIDVVADVSGAVLVVVFWFFLKRFRDRSAKDDDLPSDDSSD
jgi:VanZ family protein